jgi:esterase/lipase superfamily enzyme
MWLVCFAILATNPAQPPDDLDQPPPGVLRVQGEIIRYYKEHREIVVAGFGGGEGLYRFSDTIRVTKKGRPFDLKHLTEFVPVRVTYRQVGGQFIADELELMGEVFFHKAPESADADAKNILATVKVFFATDRAAALAGPDRARLLVMARWPLAVGAATGLLMLARRLAGRNPLTWLTAIGMMAATGLTVQSISDVNRTTGGLDAPDELFGGDRGSGLTYGSCAVTIPRNHQLGRLEGPSILKFEFRFDPEKHVALQSVNRLGSDAFFAELRQAVEQSPRREMFLFVHGYNQTFAEAARRTAQLVYDLEYAGPAMFFSWPSQGGLAAYSVDEANVEWATPDLRDVLREVAARSGARSIQLIAHSMGNRALTGAMRSLATEPGHQPSLYREVVLAAPDIDASVFQRDLFPAMRNSARRFTLYSSSNDNALMASKKVHGHPRAGDSGDLLVVLPGLDTIDVSGIDTSLLGHSYYGDSRSVITDLHHVINRGEPPQKRQWLRPKERKTLRYWLFEALRDL